MDELRTDPVAVPEGYEPCPGDLLWVAAPPQMENAPLVNEWLMVEGVLSGAGEDLLHVPAGMSARMRVRRENGETHVLGFVDVDGRGLRGVAGLGVHPETAAAFGARHGV